MYSKIKSMRIPVELQQIQKTHNEHGITCAPEDDPDYSMLIATIPGPNDSVYASGEFKVSILLNEHYPFRPPTFKFITPVFHPNIDSSGQICLDLLKMPPTGTYNPAITLQSMLLSIQLLLGTPNPDDPLQEDAAVLFKTNIELFRRKALEYTEKYANINGTFGGNKIPPKKKKKF